jgi:DNA end-binding protein Ku
VARAFWKGSLSFGLVEIPVSLRPAVEPQEMSFTLLDRHDFSPVGYRRYNKNTGREVAWNDIVRGYEYESDQYVVLSDEELRRANVRATETIDIVEFIDGKDIDTVYYDQPYYVEPLKKASKSYALLRAALERTGKIGIARVVLRTRQRIAALTVRDSALVVNLLRYPHELRSVDELEVPAKNLKSAGLSERELQMADRLIGEMTAKWKPEEFKDDYYDDVQALVRRKIKARQIHTIVEPEPEAGPKRPREVVDLMPLLKRSLSARGGAAEREGKEGRERKTTVAEEEGTPRRRAPARPKRARASAGAKRHKKSA